MTWNAFYFLWNLLFIDKAKVCKLSSWTMYLNIWSTISVGEGWEQHKGLTKLPSGLVGWFVLVVDLGFGFFFWWGFFHLKWELSPPVVWLFVTLDSYSWNQPLILQGQEVRQDEFLLSCILNVCRKKQMCPNTVLL